MVISPCGGIPDAKQAAITAAFFMPKTNPVESIDEYRMSVLTQQRAASGAHPVPILWGGTVFDLDDDPVDLDEFELIDLSH